MKTGLISFKALSDKVEEVEILEEFRAEGESTEEEVDRAYQTIFKTI